MIGWLVLQFYVVFYNDVSSARSFNSEMYVSTLSERIGEVLLAPEIDLIAQF